MPDFLSQKFFAAKRQKLSIIKVKVIIMKSEQKKEQWNHIKEQFISLCKVKAYIHEGSNGMFLNHLKNLEQFKLKEFIKSLQNEQKLPY